MNKYVGIQRGYTTTMKLTYFLAVCTAKTVKQFPKKSITESKLKVLSLISKLYEKFSYLTQTETPFFIHNQPTPRILQALTQVVPQVLPQVLFQSASLS